MVHCSRPAILGITLAALFLFPMRVRAQDDAGARAVARDLGYAGVAAFERGEYEVAADKLERAFTILEAPSLGLWSARALVKIGKFVQAAERYRRVGRINPAAGELAVQQKAQQDATSELTQLQKRIPSLVVQVEGASPKDVSFELDDSTFAAALVGEAVPVNPGSHRITATRGREVVREAVTIAEAEQRRVVLHFAASAPVMTGSPPETTPPNAPIASPPNDAAAREPLQIVGWAALGIGAAAVVTGTVVGLMAINDRSSLGDRKCDLDRNQCPGELQSDVDTYNSRLTISSVGLIGGGVLAAAGTVVLLTLPTTAHKVAMRVRPSNVALIAEF